MTRNQVLQFILDNVRPFGFTDDLKRFSQDQTPDGYIEWLLSTGIYRAFLFRKDFAQAYFDFLSSQDIAHGLTESSFFSACLTTNDPLDQHIKYLESFNINQASVEPTAEPVVVEPVVISESNDPQPTPSQ